MHLSNLFEQILNQLNSRNAIFTVYFIICRNCRRRYMFLCSFQDLYRVLLEAESDGILKDVDLDKVEDLILLRKK